MITIKKSATPAGDLPQLQPARSQQVPPGKVFVAMEENGAVQSQLTDDQRVVLESASDKKQKVELITRNNGGGIDMPGIYLYEYGDDYKKFTNTDDFTLRLYTYRDTLRKIQSVSGVVLLLPALGAVITALVSIFFLVSSQSQPSASTVAGTAQAILAWAGQPVNQLDTAKISAARVAQVRQQLDTRSRQTEWCLLAIGGQNAPAVKIPGVRCAKASTQWWQKTVTASLITGGIAVLTALVGIFALRNRYGFQRSPTS